MRTTLDIADDVLSAARELARKQGRTAGEIISSLARQALTGAIAPAVGEPKAFYGFQPFPQNGTLVTNELINDLRDRDGV